jgi:hypothetical protein
MVMARSADVRRTLVPLAAMWIALLAGALAAVLTGRCGYLSSASRFQYLCRPQFGRGSDDTDTNVSQRGSSA